VDGHSAIRVMSDQFVGDLGLETTAPGNDSTVTGTGAVPGEGGRLRWSALGLTAIIVATAGGNALVCAAVCVERRLQNITNYFLMSLAIADLLVAVLVMPLAMVVELFGNLTDYSLSARRDFFIFKYRIQTVMLMSMWSLR